MVCCRESRREKLTCCENDTENLHDAAHALQDLALREEVDKEQQGWDGVVQSPQHGDQDVHIQAARGEHLCAGQGGRLVR